MGLRISDALARTGELTREHGLRIFVDFLAVSVFVATLQSLVAPDTLRTRLAGYPGQSIVEVYMNPFVLLHEGLFAIVLGGACVRIALTEMAGSPAPGGVRNNIFPLIALNIATGLVTIMGLMIFIIPGLFLSALFTVLVPVIVIEGRSWNALSRAIAMVQGSIMRLTALWAMVLVPLVFISFAMGPSPGLVTDGSNFDVWISQITTTLYGPAIGAVATCLTMACYELLIDREADNVHDVFR